MRSGRGNSSFGGWGCKRAIEDWAEGSTAAIGCSAGTVNWFDKVHGGGSDSN